MKRFPSLVIVTTILLSACGVLPGLNPTATVTPSPTFTATPTLTPTPTHTPTATPTSTPDAAATRAAKATETAGDVLAELDKALGEDSGVPYQNGHLLWQQSKPMSIELSGPEEGFVAIGDDLKAGDFIFKSDVTWEANGLLVCGAVFRSEPNIEKGKQYLFAFLRFSGLPAWTIDVFNYGQFQNSPTDTRFSGTIDMDNGATNQFILVAQGNEFVLYMNRHREGRYYDYSTQRVDGLFGFNGSQTGGQGTCEFENSWIWSLDQ